MYIREYHKQDRTRCLSMFRSNMPLYFADHELTDYVLWLDGIDERKLAYNNSQAEMYYVLENEDAVCACGGFYISKDKNEARMCWGLVDNKYHKKGHGTILLEYRVNKIKELFPTAGIALDTSQHTFEFFEKLGFQTTCITENAYAPGLHRYDMILPETVLTKPVQSLDPSTR